MACEHPFEYYHRWTATSLANDLLSGDAARVADAVQRLEDRDRELELWLKNNACCCSDPWVELYHAGGGE